ETSYIEKLVDIMKNNELTEVTLEDNEKSIYIKSSGFQTVIKEKSQEPEAEIEKILPAETNQENEKKNLVPIVSNMIGLYFSKPSPMEPAFVSIGDEIKEGQVICIIETIKLMNKITSEISGKVAEICIKDGEPVEYGQVIMYVEQS
ncbi:MAG: biotin/lipoyl-binding protein, partial [Candidatus Gastranaerophilales bacterium]|nr:biotin/lipoyl-binding protein [Candidatus Gastranaerophilales bacterium]